MEFRGLYNRTSGADGEGLEAALRPAVFCFNYRSMGNALGNGILAANAAGQPVPEFRLSANSPRRLLAVLVRMHPDVLQGLRFCRERAIWCSWRGIASAPAGPGNATRI